MKNFIWVIPWIVFLGIAFLTQEAIYAYISIGFSLYGAVIAMEKFRLE